MEEMDFVITTGGVSVGDFDYLPAIYDELGANVLFNKIAMRPGRVLQQLLKKTENYYLVYPEILQLVMLDLNFMFARLFAHSYMSTSLF